MRVEAGIAFQNSKSKVSVQLLNLILAVWNCCILVFLASTAINQWPGLHMDSALYTTPIIKSAALKLWESDGFIFQLSLRDGNSFNFHGQLYQFVFGRLLRCATYESLFQWTAVLNCLTYAVYLGLGWKSFRLYFPRLGPCLATGMAAVAALACLNLQGRPEHLLPLLLIVPFLMHEWRVTAGFSKSAAYVGLGLTVVLSPITGVLCLFGVIAWIALRHRNQWKREIIVCGALSTSASLAVLLVACPVNPWQWAHNTIGFGGNATGLPFTVLSTNLGIFNVAALLELPLWNVFSLGAFLLLGLSLVLQRLWWLILLYVVAMLVFMIPNTMTYAYYGFSPIIMLSLLGREAALLLLPSKLRWFPTVLVSLFALCGMAGLLRALLLATLFYREGVSFQQTASTVRQLDNTLIGHQEKIGFIWGTGPSFVAFSRAEKFLVSITLNGREDDKELFLPFYEKTFHSNVRYLLVPQLGHFADPPPTLNEGKFVLEINGWTKQRARFCGLKLGGAMPGYQFALYRRKEDNAHNTLLDVR